MTNTQTLRGKTAAYLTRGCKLNFAETSSIAERFELLGVRKAKKGERADICVVNTCSVTETADQKCRQAIHRLVRQHPGAFVVVTGCYAQLKPHEVADIPGVSLVLGYEGKAHLVEEVANRIAQLTSDGYSAALSIERNSGVCVGSRVDSTAQGMPWADVCSRGDRTRHFLKVQDGCDYFCTYCTIPLARGRSRNGSIRSMVKQAEMAAAEGGREIVITGVNTGDFGRTTGETFLDLICALDQVEGIERYRISSIEPNLLTDEIIDFCASSRAFMPHFHIPLQSGCDQVLRLMRRRYDTALFRHKVEKIRRAMPDAFIGVDVIVGTRGETDECFQEALRFMSDIDVAQYHVFSYSERAGTKALEIPHSVPACEKRRRSRLALDLSASKTRDFYARFIGQNRPVLLEQAAPRKALMHGFTDNYIRVELPNTPQLAGTIATVRLNGFNEAGDALTGQILTLNS